MAELAVSGLPVVEAEEAFSETKETFDDIQRTLELPFVPNIWKTLASSDVALTGTWNVLRNIFLQTNLPMSLASMILFSIAAAKKCQYCSAVHQVTCKTLGVEEDTLAALDGDLEGLTPRRVQAIVRFAQRAALDPQGLGESDYQEVREQGVSDGEILEIIALAALGNYLDTVADAMKIDVDSVIAEALQG
jgi:uncharacterized peroxidase-related enzyme